MLVAENGEILAEDYNHVATGDHTQHPEFALARQAAANLTPEERQRATVYTSGEHCPICTAAHGWVGLGRIVYASSSQQLVEWLSSSFGIKPGRVRNLAIEEMIRDTIIDGPDLELSEQVRLLQKNFIQSKLRRKTIEPTLNFTEK